MEFPKITAIPWGHLADGREIICYTLSHANGLTLEVLNYGGIIRRLAVPDRFGNLQNVVLGFDHLEDYLNNSPYLGALVGRYANRIAYGKYPSSTGQVQLSVNHGKHHLHGGHQGFDRSVWDICTDVSSEQPRLKLSLQSPDGEEGFPGNLSISVEYIFTPEGSLQLVYTAESDRETIVNLTQHSYFNLGGELNKAVDEHRCQINASSVLAVDRALMPTGKFSPLDASPLDFRLEKPLDASQTYDHCYVLETTAGEMKCAAKVFDPGSGRTMEVWTDQPGVQLYIPQTLPQPFVSRGAFCLETQNFPDAPNHPHFPTAVLLPGQIYRSETHYNFSVIH